MGVVDFVRGAPASRVNWRAWAVTLRDGSSYHIVLEHAIARQLLQLVADGSAIFAVRGRSAVASGVARSETYVVDMGSHTLELRVRFGSHDADACAYELALGSDGGARARGAASQSGASKDPTCVKLVDGDGDALQPNRAGESSAWSGSRALVLCLLCVGLVQCLLATTAVPAHALGLWRAAPPPVAAELERPGQPLPSARPASALAVQADERAAELAPALPANSLDDDAAERAAAASDDSRAFGVEARTLAHPADCALHSTPPQPPLQISRWHADRRTPAAEQLRPSWVVPSALLPAGTGARRAAELDAAAWWALHPPPAAHAQPAAPTAERVLASAAAVLRGIGCDLDLRALQAAHASGRLVARAGAAAGATGAAGSARGQQDVLTLISSGGGADLGPQLVQLTEASGRVRRCRLHTLAEQVRWTAGSGLPVLTSALAALARADELEADAAEAAARAAGVNCTHRRGQLSALGLGDSFWSLVSLDLLARRSPLSTGVHIGGAGHMSTALAASRASPPNLHLCAEQPSAPVLKDLWEAPETFTAALDGAALDAARLEALRKALRLNRPAPTVPPVLCRECNAHIARWSPAAACAAPSGAPLLRADEVGDRLPCHVPAAANSSGGAAPAPAAARAAPDPRPLTLTPAEAADATSQAYRLAVGRHTLVQLASPAADAADLEAVRASLPPVVVDALVALFAKQANAGEVDVDSAAHALQGLARRAGARCTRVVRHSARAAGGGAERTMLALHTCQGVHTVMHHYKGQGHARRYVLFVDAHHSPPVHLMRDSDGGRIAFTRTGLTLKLLLALKPHAALRGTLLSQLVAMPLFEDMTTWNLYMSGSELVYIDQDSQQQTYDRWLPHAAALISAVSSYRRVLELLAPESCGPDPPEALVLAGPWTPLVGSCTPKAVRGAAAAANLRRCSNALSKPNVLCHDRQCRDTFVDCAAAFTPWLAVPESG